MLKSFFPWILYALALSATGYYSFHLGEPFWSTLLFFDMDISAGGIKNH